MTTNLALHKKLSVTVDTLCISEAVIVSGGELWRKGNLWYQYTDASGNVTVFRTLKRGGLVTIRERMIAFLMDRTA